jgi:hypothetical protein
VPIRVRLLLLPVDAIERGGGLFGERSGGADVVRSKHLTFPPAGYERPPFTLPIVADCVNT